MRLTTRKPSGSKLELSMTSMIDVVFLLLIFFIVTTTFVRPERQIQSAIKVSEKQSNRDPAIVEISRSGAKIIFRVGAVKSDNLDDIKKILHEFEDKSDGAFVRPADDVPFESAARAIGICKASGFSSVSYLPAK